MWIQNFFTFSDASVLAIKIFNIDVQFSQELLTLSHISYLVTVLQLALYK